LDYSHILDLNYLRPNNQTFTAPLEKYSVLIISELDKEYNSHYTTKEVGEDGVYVFFGVGSHWLQRTAKVLADYQIVTQVPLNIRGNAEMILYITETKHKMPFLLNLFSLPFKWLFGIFEQITLNYESYKLKLTKYSMRESRRIRKRYDYTALYSFLRYSLYFLIKVLDYFERYAYTKFYIEERDSDSKTLGKFKININSFDESWKGMRLYDSTFLSTAYSEKKQKEKHRWDQLPKWTSLNPSQKELEKVHSRFIDKAFNLNPQTQQGDELAYDQIETKF
jgi:hypothetical protein